jgi:hypothetical protein
VTVHKLDLDGTPGVHAPYKVYIVSIASSTLSWNEAGVIYTHPDCTEFARWPAFRQPTLRPAA